MMRQILSAAKPDCGVAFLRRPVGGTDRERDGTLARHREAELVRRGSGCI